MEADDANKRKLVVKACLALLLEEDEDAESTRKWEDEMRKAQSAYAEEDTIQEATLRERLQARPRNRIPSTLGLLTHARHTFLLRVLYGLQGSSSFCGLAP